MRDRLIPLFAQLIGQIKQAVLSDQIHPGDALPSIRQLANDLDLNNKTVAKAYSLLERDSVIQTKGIAVRSCTQRPRPTAPSI